MGIPNHTDLHEFFDRIGCNTSCTEGAVRVCRRILYGDPCGVLEPDRKFVWCVPRCIFPRHSGASRSDEPGTHEHGPRKACSGAAVSLRRDRVHGFRVRPCGPPRNDRVISGRALSHERPEHPSRGMRVVRSDGRVVHGVLRAARGRHLRGFRASVPVQSASANESRNPSFVTPQARPATPLPFGGGHRTITD